MGENGTLLHHGSTGLNGGFTNGSSSAEQDRSSSSSKHHHHHKHGRRKETEEERRIRKEKERHEREERHRREGRREETEEERRSRKERERHSRKETEEERAARKEKERRDREERHRREGRRDETEEERRVRKEKERKEREERHRREGRRVETEEERRIRKEKERRERHKSKESDEERRARKERERMEKSLKEEEQNDESSSMTQNPYHEPLKRGEETEEVVEPEEEETHSVKQKEEPMDYQEVKAEPEDSEDDMPLAKKSSKKRKSRDAPQYNDNEEDSEDDIPLSKRKKPKVAAIKKETKRRDSSHKSSSAKKSIKKEVNTSPTKSSGGRKKKEEGAEVWKWWEEEKIDDGTKWKFLEHKGPLFATDYIPLPKGVNFYYNGKKMKLSLEAEEVAGFYGRMIEHEYTEKEVFNMNFFKDWRKNMTKEEREIITHLNKCDFAEINTYYKQVSEERKNRSKEEKKAEKENNAAIQDEYGVCIIDNHKEKIGNFRIEPPGLFRGRGEHPKQGMLKKRVIPEDVIINCSKDSHFPEPPPGHRWKEVRHDNTVTWLASWTENIQNQIKYVMLNPSSKLKGEKDMLKYEKARELKSKIDKIREDYIVDFKSKEMRVRQRSVALYFIDKLALRAGNEKDDDQADTVGCCSLRVEHITLHPEKDDKEYCVEFDFLGKDSIRYHNIVPVEKRVFKNLQLFMENKRGEDDLFDRLNTTILNEYLNSLMKGLTAKVFRTYNASFTLQEQLEELTDPDDNVPAKMLSYNRANRKVAILCNHQRAAPKTHDKSMQNLQAKIDAKREAVDKVEKEVKHAKKAYKNGGSSAEKVIMEKKKKMLERTMEQLDKLETQAVDKEENKTIALGTSKLNYLDPRISVAWSKKFDVPIEKIFNKTQRDKFRWAIEMAGADYVF